MKNILVSISLLIVCIHVPAFSQPSYCSSNRFTDTPIFDSSVVRIDSNLIYGIATDYFSGSPDTLLMNVFYPDTLVDTMNSRPFILLIHGGAFLGGGLHDMDYECMSFARRGFVTATISYRLGWNCSAADFFSICVLCGNLNTNFVTATYEACQDGRAAMRFIDSHASDYNIDKQNYFIGGTSAGSITAMHVAFWDQAEADAFCPWATDQVGLLDTSGNSLTNTYEIKGVIDNCGAVSKDSVALNNGDIPIISFHDEFDCVVPNQYGQVISCFCQSFYWVAGSQVLYNNLTTNNICASMNLVPLSLTHCSYPQYELVNRASCFIRSILCDSCHSSYNNTPYTPQGCTYFTSVTQNKLEEKISFFPNPASNQIHLKGLNTSREYLIELYDLSGIEILEESISSNDNQHLVQLPSISEGLYVLKISSEIDSHFYKLLIVR